MRRNLPFDNISPYLSLNCPLLVSHSLSKYVEHISLPISYENLPVEVSNEEDVCSDTMSYVVSLLVPSSISFLP